MLNIKKYKTQLEKICIDLKLKKIDLFGSAVSEKFNDNSDVDMLVEFEIFENENFFDKYFELKTRLENLFNRPVDIVIEHAIKNPFFKQSVEKTRKNIYAA
jgi:uncharacterized protein